MQNNMMYDEQLLQALSELPPSDEPEQVPDVVNERICRLALRKIQSASDETFVMSEQGFESEDYGKTGRNHTMNKHSQKGKLGSTINRTLRISLIAAAILCGSAVTVCAVGPQLVTMLGGKIGFFEEAPSQSEVSDPVEAPRTNFVETQKKLEAYNAAIGETVTDNGVSITLDNISMDVTSMDIFLTITGQEAIDEIMSWDDYGPLWNRFFGVGPDFYYATINGETIAQYDVEDWYLNDDGSLKLWRHYILTDVPDGDEIQVVLEDNSALARSGNWKFTVTLDGESVRAGAKVAQPADFPMPEVTRKGIDGEDYTINKDLHLHYLAFGPVGGVIQTTVEEKHTTASDGSDVMLYEGMDASMLYITDNTGKELHTCKATSISGDALNLTAPAENATSITLTPVVSNENGASRETRTVSLDELKKGIKIETSAIGGYTVENFVIKDGAISYDLVPYGWSGYYSEVLRPQYDGKITQVEEEVTNLQDGGTATFLKSGLLSSTVDPQTGVVSVRHDFYAATDEELETITEWTYDYNECKLDTENAVTVSLESLD